MDTRPWHSLVAIGTAGGDPLAGGDRLAGGIHLRWSWEPGLGFPLDGYHVWRRSHRPPDWVCLDLGEHMPVPSTGGEWYWHGFRLQANAGSVVADPRGCDGRFALVLAGPTPDAPGMPVRERTLDVEWSEAASAVSGNGMGAPPEIEVFASFGGAVSLVVRERATADARQRWSFVVWAEGIVRVRISATSLRICDVCVGVPDVSGRWERLTEEPILLPVVARRTANAAAHIHERASTLRVATSRLSATLPEETRQRLADGFAGEMRQLAERLLRDGRRARLSEDAGSAQGNRTAPDLGMTAASAVALTSLDPDVARMLGLYWHDPVGDGTWDYKVVAHHGSARYPSRLVTFENADVGPVATPTFSHRGVTAVGSGGLEVIELRGGARALRVESPRPGTTAGVQLSRRVPAVTLHLANDVSGAFTAWRGQTIAAAGFSLTRFVRLEEARGIDAISWIAGPVDLQTIELFEEAGPVGDLAAYAWNVSHLTRPPVHQLTLAGARAAAERPRVAPDGTAGGPHAVVGLDWTFSDSRDAGTPVRVFVARSDRGEGDAPGAGGPFELRNGEQPALAVAPRAGRADSWPGPDVPRCWTERGVAPGWTAWKVRGIDLFGRVGPWSAERIVDTRVGLPPPPPDTVTARYLEPADPYLTDDERALVAADGPGLLVQWTWPAGHRLRAPHVEAAGEFRVYVRRDDPNVLSGRVLSVADRGDRSRLVTDLDIAASGTLTGERLRLGGSSFTIVGSGAGPNAAIDVRHLAAPTGRPAPGAFTVRLSDRHPRHASLSDTRTYDRRVHAHGAGKLPRVTAIVTGVEATSGGGAVTLDRPLPAAMGAVSTGRLVSRGIAFPVVHKAIGSTRVEIRGALQAASGATALPQRGDAVTIWTDAAYRAWIPGVVLRPRPGEALVQALVAVTACDGDRSVADHPQWSDGAHGTLGGRPGRESRPSRVARVHVPRRTRPAPVSVVRPPEIDGDIPADRAEPADWYGRARYTLQFPHVAGTAGYRVLRASVASLFTRDRVLRQTGGAPYAGGPFTAGDGSDAWLAEHYPGIAVTDLTADLSSHPDAAGVLDAWRAWAEWYYPQLSNRQVMDLADLDGNRDAFLPAHAGTIDRSPFRDTLDGRGLGRFVYRVRSVDASGNAGEWSLTFPIVELRDVTPPQTPTLIEAGAADNAAGLRWLRGREADLLEYRVWRADAPSALADVRRLPPSAVIGATHDASGVVVHVDAGLEGLTTWYFRVAAVDTAGNVSEPTSIVAVRVPDSLPPVPPVWERAEWIRVDARGREYQFTDPDAIALGLAPAIALAWLASEPGVVAAVERRSGAERTWRTIASRLAPLDSRDRAADAARRFIYRDPTASVTRLNEYRIRLTDPAGNTNLRDVSPTSVERPDAAHLAWTRSSSR